MFQCGKGRYNANGVQVSEHNRYSADSIRTVIHPSCSDTSCIYLVPLGRLHMRPIQLHILAMWRPNIPPPTHVMMIRSVLLPHVKWCTCREFFSKGVPLQDPSYQLTLITYASEHRWRARLEDWETTGVCPLPQYQKGHKNWLE